MSAVLDAGNIRARTALDGRRIGGKRLWLGEKTGRQPRKYATSAYRRLFAANAPIWDELPELTTEQRELVFEPPLDETLDRLRGEVRALTFAARCVAERRAVAA